MSRSDGCSSRFWRLPEKMTSAVAASAIGREVVAVPTAMNFIQQKFHAAILLSRQGRPRLLLGYGLVSLSRKP